MIWRVKNPHLRLAIIIAPMLAIFGWGLAEMWWNYHNPQIATNKRPYTLCDLERKDCLLVRDEARLALTGVYDGERRLTGIELTSNVTLAQVFYAIGPKDADTPPQRLASDDGRVWRTAPGEVNLAAPDPGNLILRMVARSHKGEYIGEMKFRY
jgi:hypothetical protein